MASYSVAFTLAVLLAASVPEAALGKMMLHFVQAPETAITGTFGTEAYDVKELKVPPEPEGTAPAKNDDGAYGTKADACSACRFAATGSCAMYKTCVCYATNAFFPMVGIPQTDKSFYKWACGNEGGSKYELCFDVNQLYEDPFGDKIDPNNLKCP